MREILFRGERKDFPGGWVYGWYQPPVKWGNNNFGTSISHFCDEGWLDDTEVIPETVGQFTGLTDENGKQIFEGDIVEPVLTGGTHKGFSWGRQVVVFDRGAFGLKSRRGEITPMCNYAANVRFKVWGNIHDNPELLEVKE